MLSVVATIVGVFFLLWAVRTFVTDRVSYPLRFGGIGRRDDPVIFWFHCVALPCIGLLFLAMGTYPGMDRLREHFADGRVMFLFPVLWLLVSLYAVHSIGRGQVSGGNGILTRHRVIRRDEQPVRFWITVVFMLLFGIVMAVVQYQAILSGRFGG